MIWLVALAVLCAGAGMAAWAVRGRSSEWLAPSVWRGPRDRKAVALSFDDGPSESTGQILELLARYGARATFFQIGQHVDRLPHVTQQVVAAGCEVANHSYSHPRFDFTSSAFQSEELRKTQCAIEAACGVKPVWFRAPFGVRWAGLAKAQKDCQLTGAMWTVLARDWKLNSNLIIERVLTRVGNGAIVCLHDGRGLDINPDVSATMEALSRLLPVLKDRGFEMVTISELFAPRKARP